MQYRPRAWIITVGNELLIGRIVNTNAAWIASKLTFHGVIVERIVTVGDTVDDIVEILREAVRRSDIVVSTGGLGPTADDLTMEAVAAALNRPLVLNREAYEMVKSFYEKRGHTLTPEARKMAFLPLGAIPIPNPEGAAPGAWIRFGRSQVFVLPGVPREMEAMMEYVVEKLRPILPRICVKEKSLLIEGIPEARLASLLRRAAKKCPTCYTKSHPKGHEGDRPLIDVRVLASAEDCGEAEKLAEGVIEELKRLLGRR
jgi:molybdenum cofactor synthesis domain-containing protein